MIALLQTSQKVFLESTAVALPDQNFWGGQKFLGNQNVWF